MNMENGIGEVIDAFDYTPNQITLYVSKVDENAVHTSIEVYDGQGKQLQVYSCDWLREYMSQQNLTNLIVLQDYIYVSNMSYESVLIKKEKEQYRVVAHAKDLDYRMLPANFSSLKDRNNLLFLSPYSPYLIAFDPSKDSLSFIQSVKSYSDKDLKLGYVLIDQKDVLYSLSSIDGAKSSTEHVIYENTDRLMQNAVESISLGGNDPIDISYCLAQLPNNEPFRLPLE